MPGHDCCPPGLQRLLSDSPPPRKQWGPDRVGTISPPYHQGQRFSCRKQTGRLDLPTSDLRGRKKVSLPRTLECWEQLGGFHGNSLMTNTRQGGLKIWRIYFLGRSTATGRHSPPLFPRGSLSFGERAPLFSEVPLGRLGCGEKPHATLQSLKKYSHNDLPNTSTHIENKQTYKRGWPHPQPGLPRAKPTEVPDGQDAALASERAPRRRAGALSLELRTRYQGTNK